MPDWLNDALTIANTADTALGAAIVLFIVFRAGTWLSRK